MDGKLLDFFNEILEMAAENQDLLSILEGYCNNNMMESTEAGTILTIVEEIKKRQSEIINKIDTDSIDFCKRLIAK